jgi:hypothetical protein
MILLSVAAGRLRLRALRRAARPPADAEWLPLLRLLGERLRIRRRVTLLRSADGLMPATWGLWKPVILLPAQAEVWPPERRRLVLLHELAHVKRWDCLTQMMARLACAVHWFNPLAWLAARQMCLERERACDDLVLEDGCKASEYAAHLLEIARSFRRVPQVAAIAMARSTRLRGRIAAIVDGSRARRRPRGLPVGLCCAAVLALVAAVAAQKTETALPAPGTKPWFDARLRAFFAAKAAQARQMPHSPEGSLAPVLWSYLDAGARGDWAATTNLWLEAWRARTNGEPGLHDTPVWSIARETDLALEQFAHWTRKYALAYGNDIIKSIPPGGIYFGGTDAGRGIITAMSESHAEGKPFFTLTENLLVDSTYLAYLRAMYGRAIQIPTEEDWSNCFQGYIEDAGRRFAEHKLKPGEDVRVSEGRVQVAGQVAVMTVNDLLAKIIFDRNPEREFYIEVDRNPDRKFYIEESSPLEWMYAYLCPNGLIMKINRSPLRALPDDLVRRDHEYWSKYLRPLLGDWLGQDTSVAEVAAFVERVHGRHDLRGLGGDPEFVGDPWAQQAFSKLRSAIARVYNWRMRNADSPAEKQRMTKEAEFAFRQAYALCPISPEAVFGYAALLVSLDRVADARLLAETTLKLDPKNAQVESLLKQNLQQR